MTTTEQRKSSEAPRTSQIRLEEAAIAILLDRIVGLDQEVKDDLMAVLMEIPKGASSGEVAEAEETIRELLYPDLAGDLIVGKAGNPQSTEKLAKWKQGIGERIKGLRTAKNMRQEDLAKAASLPQSHISRLETGQHSPSHKTVLALALALGVDVREIDPAVE